MTGALPAGRPRDALVAEVVTGLAPLPHRSGVVVACSGGPDSTALAYLTAEARPDLRLILGHVRHGLRDDQHDLALVTEHARWLDARLEVRDVAVVATGAGPGAAARTARHEALVAVRRRTGARAILFGHTADDQAETVLMRLVRGTGLSGAGAMAFVDGDRWHPLLRVRRADLHAFVVGEGIPFVEDPSNLSPTQPRARARHDLLPALRALGPDPVGALARFADLARADDRALGDWAAQQRRRHVHRVGTSVSVPLAALEALPVAVVSRVVRDMVAEVRPGPPPRAADVDRILAAHAGQRTLLQGGVVAGAGGGWLAIASTSLAPTPAVELAPGRRVEWPPAGIALRALAPGDEAGTPGALASPAASAPQATAASPGAGVAAQASLDLPGMWRPPEVRPPAHLAPPGGAAERLAVVLPGDLGPLTVRHRSPGDRIRTAAGTKRVAAVLIDLGVPLPVRDRWPVVVADGRIVWIPGIAVDDAALAAGRAGPGLLVTVEQRRHRH